MILGVLLVIVILSFGIYLWKNKTKKPDSMIPASAANYNSPSMYNPFVFQPEITSNPLATSSSVESFGTDSSNVIAIAALPSKRDYNFKAFGTVFAVLGGLLAYYFWKGHEKKNSINDLEILSKGNSCGAPNRSQFFIRVVGTGASINQANSDMETKKESVKNQLQAIVPNEKIYESSVSIFQGLSQGIALISGPNMNETILSNPEISTSPTVSGESIPPSNFILPIDSSYFSMQTLTLDINFQNENSIMTNLINVAKSANGFVITFNSVGKSLEMLEVSAIQNAIEEAKKKGLLLSLSNGHTKISNVKSIKQQNEIHASSSIFSNNNIDEFKMEDVKVHLNLEVLACFQMD